MDELIIQKLAELSAKNIQLWTEKGKIKFKAAAGVLTQADREFLKENREAVIQTLLNDEVHIVADKKGQYEPFNMTEIQQAYVLGRNPAFEYGGVACHIYMELEYNSLDPQRVQEVWNKLIDRHPMLRAVMSMDGYQYIMSEVPEFKVNVIECNENNEDEKRDKIKKELDHKIYNPEKWPLYSVTVSKGINKDILHFSIEFVVADWSSIWTVLSEFESLYFHPEKKLPSIELTFRDYIMAEKRLRQGSKYQRDKAYWINRIDTLPPAPELPIKSASNTENVRFLRNQFSLSKEAWDNFCENARKFGVTPTSAVISAYGLVLSRWSKNKAFCLNLSILNRLELHPQISSVVGDFTASSLLEMEHKDKLSFKDIALMTNRQLFDDLDHRLFTGVNVLREIQKRKSKLIMPYVFTGAIGLISPENSNLIGKMNNNGISQTPQVFMDCQAMDTIEGLNINIDSRADVFPDGMVSDICTALEQLLIALSNDESFWIKNPFRIGLLERQLKIRTEVNATKTKQRKYLLHQKVLEQLEKHPKSFAVADAQASWSCEELYGKVKEVADNLKSMGIGRGDFVAIALPKSRWQVAACLGVLVSGAAYVPLDIKSASKRSEIILNKVSAKSIICHSNYHFSDLEGFPILDIDNLKTVKHEITNPFESDMNDTAYIIFTSGSTGEPKGVTMSHGAAVNTIEGINKIFNINENDRVFSISQLNFDLSVYDIFGVIAQGGGIVIPDNEQCKNPAHWVEMINKYKVTVWNSVPALMQLLLIYQSYNKDMEINPLRVVLLSGDWIPKEQPDKLKKLFPDVRVVSLGGATEGGIWSIYHECDSEYDNSSIWKSIPYGKPLPNQGFMILDSLYQDCPDWVQGELFITGESLATSYWGESDLTEKSFIDINGVRAYKTGDTGCYHPDGEIEFLGRKDNQVKLRGHRIELGEVEYVIRKQLDTENVSCVIYEDNNDRKLAAVIEGKHPINEKILKEKLKAWLPDYMVPTICVITDRIELTANGKIDRKKLVSLIKNHVEKNEKTYFSNKEMNETQKAVINIMSEILKFENLGLDDDFYEVGANSLILARIAGKLNQEVESSIPFDSYLIQMLNVPNVRALAGFIDEKKAVLVKNDDIKEVGSALRWYRVESSKELCVTFTDGIDINIIKKCTEQKNRTHMLVDSNFDFSKLVELILKEEFETLTFLTTDKELINCLKTATLIMEQGIVPECIKVIETEFESEFILEVPYMGDINFALTVSDISESEDIINILSEFCIGNIEIEDCKAEEQLMKFIE